MRHDFSVCLRPIVCLCFSKTFHSVSNHRDNVCLRMLVHFWTYAGFWCIILCIREILAHDQAWGTIFQFVSDQSFVFVSAKLSTPFQTIWILFVWECQSSSELMQDHICIWEILPQRQVWGTIFWFVIDQLFVFVWAKLSTAFQTIDIKMLCDLLILTDFWYSNYQGLHLQDTSWTPSVSKFSRNVTLR